MLLRGVCHGCCCSMPKCNASARLTDWLASAGTFGGSIMNANIALVHFLSTLHTHDTVAVNITGFVSACSLAAAVHNHMHCPAAADRPLASCRFRTELACCAVTGSPSPRSSWV